VARRVLDTFLLVVGLLAAWQLIHLYSGDVAVSSPAATAHKAVELLMSAALWPHVLETATALGYSLAVAIPAGLAMGFLLGMRRLPGEVAEPLLVSLYSLPKVTLYPLVLLLFGLGMSAKVAFGALHGVIPVTLFSMNAVRTVSPVFFKAARVMQLSRSGTVLHVALPAALPEIFSGIRVGFSLTLLGVLIGEMFASQRGLGFLIMNLIDVHDVPRMMAVTLLLAVFAVAVNLGLLVLDHRLHRRV
jgi:NitT/TauT family transport system permease protein